MTTDPPEDPLPPLPESSIVEDEPILVNDDHTIPAPADMVEWTLLTLGMGVVIPVTLTLFWVYIQLYILIYFICTTLYFSILSIVRYYGWIRWIHPLSEGEGVRVRVWSGYKRDSGSAGVYIPFIYIYLGRTLPYPVHGTTSYKVVWFYWVNISSIN